VAAHRSRTSTRITSRGNRCRAGITEQHHRPLGTAVNKFCAEFRRRRTSRYGSRPHAAADAISRFHDEHGH